MAETEKITVNLSPVDLGQIDLLVEQGFYSNRTDLIRAAIRRLLNEHAETIQDTARRQGFILGILTYERNDLEQLRGQGERLVANVIGMIVIADDVTPELARETIAQLKIHGVFRASQEVQDALQDRIH